MLNPVIDIVYQGGWIMLPIMVISLLVWFLGLFKIYQLTRFCKAGKKFHFEFMDIIGGKKQFKTGEFHYDYLAKRINSLEKPAQLPAKDLFEEFFIISGFFLNQGLGTMKVLISIAPLLGLLGTVAGMIKTFELITLFGAGNPVLTAEGISVALVTTEAGLVVALPGLLLHNFISNRATKIKKLISLEQIELIKQYDLLFEEDIHGGERIK